MRKPEPVTIDYVPSKFSRMAVTPSALSRDEALKRATEAVANLMPEAEAWLAADLDQLSELLEQMQRSGGPTEDELRRAYMLGCSIRDGSGQFGRNGMSIVANSFCELISRMRAAGKYHKDALATHLNAIRLVSKTGLSGMTEKNLETLANNLRELVDMFPNPDVQLRAEQAEKRRQWEAKQKAAGNTP